MLEHITNGKIANKSNYIFSKKIIGFTIYITYNLVTKSIHDFLNAVQYGLCTLTTVGVTSLVVAPIKVVLACILYTIIVHMVKWIAHCIYKCTELTVDDDVDDFDWSSKNSSLRSNIWERIFLWNSHIYNSIFIICTYVRKTKHQQHLTWKWFYI